LTGDAEAGRGRSAPDGSRQIELWCVDLQAAASALDAVERRTPRLAPSDRERAAAFTDKRVAAERLATYIALRILIERGAGADWRAVPLQRGTYGKPHLENAPVAFSYSHAPGVALVGIASSGAGCSAVGVDIELLRPVRVRAPRRHAVEVAAAGLSDRDALPIGEEARFLQAWVRLESFAKLHGSGVGRLLARLGIMGAHDVTSDDVRARVQRARSEEPATVVHDLHLGEKLFAAVAARLTASVAQPQWLPANVDGIETLLAGHHGGFGVDRGAVAGQKGAGGA
jgi:4'-phosphopantetheinyl transferase